MDEDQRIRFASWDGSEVDLVGWNRISRWLREIEDFWRPLEGAAVASDPLNVRGNVFHRLNEIRARTEGFRSTGGAPNEFSGVLQAYVNEAWGLPHPNSPKGLILKDVLAAGSAESVFFAFAFLRGHAQPGHAHNLAHMQGMVLSAVPGLAMLTSGQKRLAAERANFLAATRRLSDEMVDAGEARSAAWDDLTAQATQRMVFWARRRSNGWRRAMARWRLRNDAAISSIEATENAYKELMKLKAPVDYWNDKADKHRAAEGWAVFRVASFFVLALPLMISMFTFSAWFLLEHSDPSPPPGLYVIAGAGLATTAGLLFWIGRLFTKLYLSEHHLRHDAEERAVMTTTYLALTAEQAAEDADRQIILSALFRTTSDGIVKEEGGLDPNLASVLSKLAMR